MTAPGWGTPSWAASEAGLVLVVSARAAWPEPGDTGTPPPPAGFVGSSFPGLVSTVADRCLERGAQRAADAAGRTRRSPLAKPVRRTAVIVVSLHGDTDTATAVAQAVDAGDRVQPLLFFQSVPNAVAGRIAARWGLNGPVVCVSPMGDPAAEGRELAELVIRDGDADEALLLLVQRGADGPPDRATGLLLTVAQPTENTDEGRGA